MTANIRLQTSSILHVPIYNYVNDFSFIVNGEEYQTNKYVADLLSPTISTIHQIDPTQSEYVINTKSQGNFNTILNLLKFNSVLINDSDIPFISEVLNVLGIFDIDINLPNSEITMDTVIDLIKGHETNSNFYLLKLNEEIDFLSEHFYELSESQEKEIQEMNPNIIERIIRNKKLSLYDEDQLLHFINQLFTMNNEFSPLYEEVIFTNISCECVEEFISVFDSSQMTIGTWNSISKRLVEEIQKKKEDKNERYCKNYTKIPFLNESLNGIFSYLRSNSNIKEEVEVTYSSKSGGDDDQLLDISNQKNYFYSSNSQDSDFMCILLLLKEKMKIKKLKTKNSNI
ncbi:hypothetical protein M9Y10_037312 [Tritrichomonas musculus]|uniref:BTB domain-containing protein n=1 Tax=Tritrichomonas musculus TaxID=1915356 RepID=A0ABR2GS68_9EUKA